MPAVVIAAVLLGLGMGSLLHGTTSRDWWSTRIGSALTIASSLIAIITAAAMVVNSQ